MRRQHKSRNSQQISPSNRNLRRNRVTVEAAPLKGDNRLRLPNRQGRLNAISQSSQLTIELNRSIRRQTKQGPRMQGACRLRDNRSRRPKRRDRRSSTFTKHIRPTPRQSPHEAYYDLTESFSHAKHSTKHDLRRTVPAALETNARREDASVPGEMHTTAHASVAASQRKYSARNMAHSIKQNTQVIMT